MSRFIINSEVAREMLSEFIGTFLLVLFNIGGPLNLALSGVSNAFLANVTGAAGVFLGVVTAMSNSGGHVNPIVTTSFASRGLLPWRKVPHYLIAQYIGGFIAAVVVYINFAEGIAVFDGGNRVYAGTNATGIFFAAYPNPEISLITCIFDTMLCSALLLFAVCAITDLHNSAVPVHLWAPCISFAVLAIASAFSFNCSAAMNPARDLAPRLFTTLAGYGLQGFTAHKSVFWMVATLVPHLGGFIGAQVYHFAIGLQKPGEQARIEQAKADNKLIAATP